MSDEQPPDTAASRPTEAPTKVAPAAREPALHTIDRYRLLERIGEGGMGEVHLAEQTSPIRRRVAIKIIKQGMDTREVVARFQTERQVLAMMDHPAIAKVYDAGATDQGRPYFAMEYIEGLPITDYCDRHRLGTRERLELFVRVCEGIQHAHQKAVIHRDLKPGNVLVTLREDRPLPKIIDFGVAKATGQSFGEKTLFTSLGQMIGTPEYMSPEQVEMGGESLDTRTDIYSLGVLLYELMTGVLPFDPSQLRRGGYDAIRRRIMEEDPPRPSTRLTTLGEGGARAARNRGTEPGRLMSELRGDLDAIAMKALEKDRARRYATANAFAQDILRYLRNEPVTATPPTAGYRLAKLVRRNRGLFASIAAILVVLIAATAVSTSLFLRARSESRRLEQVVAFMRDMLSGVGPSVAMGRDTQMLREILDRTADRSARDLAATPLVEADIRSVLADTYRDLGEFAAAEENQRRALALLRARRGPDSPEALQAEAGLGILQLGLGRLQAADSMLTRTAAAQSRVMGADHPQTLQTGRALAEVLYYVGALDRAESLAVRAVDGLQRSLGEDAPETLRSQFTLGQILTDQRRYAEAETVLRSLLDRQRRIHGVEHPQSVSAMITLGWTHRLAREPAAAESLTRDGLAIARRVMGNDHPETGVAINNLGIIYKDLGRMDLAEPLYLENVELGDRVLGPRHPEAIAGLVNLASFYEAGGRFAEAERHADESLRRFEGVVAGDFVGRGIALSVRGHARTRLDRPADGVRDLLGAWEILAPQFGEESPRVRRIAELLADAYARRGRHDDAVAWRAKAGG